MERFTLFPNLSKLAITPPHMFHLFRHDLLNGFANLDVFGRLLRLLQSANVRGKIFTTALFGDINCCKGLNDAIFSTSDRLIANESLKFIDVGSPRGSTYIFSEFIQQIG